jgi:hypothetical protein
LRRMDCRHVKLFTILTKNFKKSEKTTAFFAQNLKAIHRVLGT